MRRLLILLMLWPTIAVSQTAQHSPFTNQVCNATGGGLSADAISGAGSDSSIGGGEEVPVNDAGTLKKVTTLGLRNYGLAGIAGGKTIIGGTGSSEQLNLVTTSDSAKGCVHIDDAALCYYNNSGEDVLMLRTKSATTYSTGGSTGWLFAGRMSIGNGASTRLYLDPQNDRNMYARDVVLKWSNNSGEANDSSTSSFSRCASGVMCAGDGGQNANGSFSSKWKDTGVGANVASSSTISPTSGLFHLTGTASVTTINLPYTGFTGCIHVIPDGLASLDTGGNIAVPSSLEVGRVNTVCYDGTSWYPSY